MNKDEKILEILNFKPIQKIGLDDFYGRQTVINMLNEAIDYSSCCKSDSEQLPDANKHQCNCSNAKDRLDCGFECYNK